MFGLQQLQVPVIINFIMYLLVLTEIIHFIVM